MPLSFGNIGHPTSTPFYVESISLLVCLFRPAWPLWVPSGCCLAAPSIVGVLILRSAICPAVAATQSVEVKKARLQGSTEDFHSYVTVKLQNVKSTTVAVKGARPSWEQEFVFETNRLDQGLTLELWNKGVLWDKLIGVHYVALNSVQYSMQAGSGKWLQIDQELETKNGEAIGTRNPTGHSVLVDLHFELPFDAQQEWAGSDELQARLETLNQLIETGDEATAIGNHESYYGTTSVIDPHSADISFVPHDTQFEEEDDRLPAADDYYGTNEPAAFDDLYVENSQWGVDVNHLDGEPADDGPGRYGYERRRSIHEVDSDTEGATDNNRGTSFYDEYGRMARNGYDNDDNMMPQYADPYHPMARRNSPPPPTFYDSPSTYSPTHPNGYLPNSDAQKNAYQYNHTDPIGHVRSQIIDANGHSRPTLDISEDEEEPNYNVTSDSYSRNKSDHTPIPYNRPYDSEAPYFHQVAQNAQKTTHEPQNRYLAQQHGESDALIGPSSSSEFQRQRKESTSSATPTLRTGSRPKISGPGHPFYESPVYDSEEGGFTSAGTIVSASGRVRTPNQQKTSQQYKYSSSSLASTTAIMTNSNKRIGDEQPLRTPSPMSGSRKLTLGVYCSFSADDEPVRHRGSTVGIREYERNDVDVNVPPEPEEQVEHYVPTQSPVRRYNDDDGEPTNREVPISPQQYQYSGESDRSTSLLEQPQEPTVPISPDELHQYEAQLAAAGRRYDSRQPSDYCLLDAAGSAQGTSLPNGPSLTSPTPTYDEYRATPNRFSIGPDGGVVAVDEQDVGQQMENEKGGHYYYNHNYDDTMEVEQQYEQYPEEETEEPLSYNSRPPEGTIANHYYPPAIQQIQDHPYVISDEYQTEMLENENKLTNQPQQYDFHHQGAVQDTLQVPR
ncbi:c2 domain-containing protein [Ditylenchus destructor]|uniref:C2 domain-containing protein n=1 Tax=Ditylenchus destructor TaxID=166010 RepID=A0AAD4NHL7_9BILA|nr:c2 domain-containing protein [Ditylenchus destructor]